jgi:hypothetical protein
MLESSSFIRLFTKNLYALDSLLDNALITQCAIQNTEMLHVVKSLEEKRKDVKGQLEGNDGRIHTIWLKAIKTAPLAIEYPLIQIKENIARLELHPAAVDVFLQETEARIESVLHELRSHSLQKQTA